MHRPLRNARLAIALSLVLVAGVAHAVPGKDPVAYEGHAPRDFPAQVAEIEAGMQYGGPFAALDEGQQARVRRLLADMAGILDGVDSVERLSQPDVARLFNAQEEANALLTGRPMNERMVCKRERKLGSNLSHMNCQVIAESDQRRAFDGQAVRDLRQPPKIGESREGVH
jgi:hypothetical protein